MIYLTHLNLKTKVYILVINLKRVVIAISLNDNPCMRGSNVAFEDMVSYNWNNKFRITLKGA